jgi:superfamily II DNA or RNA helicase
MIDASIELETERVTLRRRAHVLDAFSAYRKIKLITLRRLADNRIPLPPPSLEARQSEHCPLRGSFGDKTLSDIRDTKPRLRASTLIIVSAFNLKHLMSVATLAPGARILVRDAEWLVRRADRTSTGGQALSVVGLSELVKDKEAVFLDEIENQTGDGIEVLDPAETRLVSDASSSFRDSLLYIESLLRQTPPTDEKLYCGYHGAIDAVPYQLDPAIQALQQPRQRILLADAVGLGKTIEAGILLAELIRRGRGKRILVCTVKSMLTQFQKELWARFTIPLVRLDSVGIQRIRNRIPTNHNPFYYYDKTIISIDTLKQDAEYRTYLERSYWDIIVIDEAHNVAERGTNSMRSKLAKLLSSRSDTLIMLSATPHDGKPKSFASLMNMLNPTAIANPEDYGPEDIKGLFIRRFKKDIKDQVATSFQERVIRIAKPQATTAEEKVFELFTALQFTRLDQRRTAGDLFKTTLEKALFSSPSACLQTIHNRVNRLQKEDPKGFAQDIIALENLAVELQKVGPIDFEKYQEVLRVIRDSKQGFGWNGHDPKDRLVIFTERIETLKFLEQNLKRDLKLKDNQVATLHGSMDDIEQQSIVEHFGNESAPMRLLIASDVASEGINLHYLSHRMIHFDIPWSLMVFQQRNGRIDRYGQEQQPQIVYLATQSTNPKIKGDTRILELLIQKDEQAAKNVGDPSAFMGVYDIAEEEKLIARAIENGQTVEQFEKSLQEKPVDLLALLMGDQVTPTGQNAVSAKASMPSLFPNDYQFFKEAIDYIRRDNHLQVEFDAEKQFVTLTAPRELQHRLQFLPREIVPEDGRFALTSDRDLIKKEIIRCRKEEQAWPEVTLLWEQHPVLSWVTDKLVAAFGRHEAPVLSLSGCLKPGESVFLVSGLIPNLKSHPLIHRWFGIRFRDGKFADTLEFVDVLKLTGLNQTRHPNTNNPIDLVAFKELLPAVVTKARECMSQCRTEYIQRITPQLNEHFERLNELRSKRFDQLELRFAGEVQLTSRQLNKKERERREIEKIFAEWQTWVEETMKTEDNPYIRIVAVLKGEK